MSWFPSEPGPAALLLWRGHAQLALLVTARAVFRGSDVNVRLYETRASTHGTGAGWQQRERGYADTADPIFNTILTKQNSLPSTFTKN